MLYGTVKAVKDFPGEMMLISAEVEARSEVVRGNDTVVAGFGGFRVDVVSTGGEGEFAGGVAVAAVFRRSRRGFPGPTPGSDRAGVRELGASGLPPGRLGGRTVRLTGVGCSLNQTAVAVLRKRLCLHRLNI